MAHSHVAAIRALPEDQFVQWYEAWKKLQRQALRHDVTPDTSMDVLRENHRAMRSLVTERQQMENDLGIPSQFAEF